MTNSKKNVQYLIQTIILKISRKFMKFFLSKFKNCHQKSLPKICKGPDSTYFREYLNEK